MGSILELDLPFNLAAVAFSRICHFDSFALLFEEGLCFAGEILNEIDCRRNGVYILLQFDLIVLS